MHTGVPNDFVIWQTKRWINFMKLLLRLTACIHHADVFRPWSPVQAAKSAFVCPRSSSKGPNHAFRTVLTSETPCIFLDVLTKESRCEGL